MEQEQQEHAPQYSLQERVRYAVVGVACLSILFAVCEWWAFPQWREFAQTAHCRTVLGIPGISVLLYVTLVGLPLAAAIALGAIIVPSALRSIRARRYPPPGKKVFGKVRIRTGWRAIVPATAELASIAAFVAIAAWGSLQVPEILGHSRIDVRKCSLKANASLHGEALRKGTLATGSIANPQSVTA